MSPGDVLKREPPPDLDRQFPDEWSSAGLKLPLTYKFDPGFGDDGVTLTVPLAALNQLRPEPFEWLVPGYVEEKILSLIRSLPRQLRVNFVPAPDFAASAVKTI